MTVNTSLAGREQADNEEFVVHLPGFAASRFGSIASHVIQQYLFFRGLLPAGFTASDQSLSPEQARPRLAIL